MVLFLYVRACVRDAFCLSFAASLWPDLYGSPFYSVFIFRLPYRTPKPKFGTFGTCNNRAYSITKKGPFLPSPYLNGPAAHLTVKHLPSFFLLAEVMCTPTVVDEEVAPSVQLNVTLILLLFVLLYLNMILTVIRLGVYLRCLMWCTFHMHVHPCYSRIKLCKHLLSPRRILSLFWEFMNPSLVFLLRDSQRVKNILLQLNFYL